MKRTQDTASVQTAESEQQPLTKQTQLPRNKQ